MRPGSAQAARSASRRSVVGSYSDMVSAITGGIGLAASGNINPDRTAPSMFEPVHGSAPDIAGKGVARPDSMIAAIHLAATMVRGGG